MLLADVAAVSEQVAATSSRTAKIALIAEVLRRAAPAEQAIVADYLAGVLPQGKVGIGWRSLGHDEEAAAAEPTLQLSAVHATITQIAATHGTGSAAKRAGLLAVVWRAATPSERRLLRGILLGDLRQGAGDGIMLKAIAQAAEISEAAVRRAVMLAGFVGPVAEAALGGGTSALEAIRLEVGRPLRPMLAASAPDIPSAVEEGKHQVAELKLDGIRCQAHKSGDDVTLFTRSLDDITDRLPEVVSAVRQLDVETAVLDGEVIALRPDQSPHPFQVTGARTASSQDPAALAKTTPVTPWFFDLLHLDGQDLVDLPHSERHAKLAHVIPQQLLVPSVEITDEAVAQRFFDEWVGKGHEGVVVKDSSAPYAAGRRGAGWVKVKPRHTLDLVVLAVEWGSGRRTGWLSNIHLGARDGDGFVMLGKTFKGMTDQMLRWQTQRFQELKTSESGYVVRVRPEQVVEIAFDGLQRSSRYPGGVALRFARVLRYRDDKTAEQADTLDTVLRLGGTVDPDRSDEGAAT